MSSTNIFPPHPLPNPKFSPHYSIIFDRVIIETFFLKTFILIQIYQYIHCSFLCANSSITPPCQYVYLFSRMNISLFYISACFMFHSIQFMFTCSSFAITSRFSIIRLFYTTALIRKLTYLAFLI